MIWWAQYHLNSNFDYTTYINEDDEMPVTGADNGLTLADLRGADYDDERWDELLDQLTVDDMSNMIALSGLSDSGYGFRRKRLPLVDADGPAAINKQLYRSRLHRFPCRGNDRMYMESGSGTAVR